MKKALSYLNSKKASSDVFIQTSRNWSRKSNFGKYFRESSTSFNMNLMYTLPYEGWEGNSIVGNNEEIHSNFTSIQTTYRIVSILKGGNNKINSFGQSNFMHYQRNYICSLNKLSQDSLLSWNSAQIYVSPLIYWRKYLLHSKRSANRTNSLRIDLQWYTRR